MTCLLNKCFWVPVVVTTNNFCSVSECSAKWKRILAMAGVLNVWLLFKTGKRPSVIGCGHIELIFVLKMMPFA